jgi:hypothetical protein
MGLMAPIVVEGQSFPRERALQPRAGMPPAEAEALQIARELKATHRFPESAA